MQVRAVVPQKLLLKNYKGHKSNKKVGIIINAVGLAKELPAVLETEYAQRFCFKKEFFLMGETSLNNE